MSQNHLSNNLDKIIQLISIEQVRCLMKQMKIDDNSFSEATVNETNNTSATNTIASGETLEQLTKINNTLLLIVDKISAIETEIKMLKEVKQQRCDDDEEHIKLQIEEKEVDVINSTENVAENLDEEEVEDSDDEIVEVECDEVDLLEEVLSSLKSVEENLETAEADEVSDAEVSDDEKKEEDVVEEVEEVESEEETDESEVEIEDDEPLSVAESKAKSVAESVGKVSKTAEISETVNLEEDEEEVFEIEIDDVTYFATHEENGILYEVDKDGDVGKKVGIIKDGEPIFL